MSPAEYGMIRGALTDDRGAWDVAYISLFFLMLVVVGSVPFMGLMSTISYWRCVQMVPSPTPGQVIPVPCHWDPQPLGIAIGAACGGFATALGGLAAYMAATRRNNNAG